MIRLGFALELVLWCVWCFDSHSECLLQTAQLEKIKKEKMMDPKMRMKPILLLLASLAMYPVMSAVVSAGQLSGVIVEDQVTLENGDTLLLNGMGAREKFWVDVYVGSLYLVSKANNVADILAAGNAWRVQMDFVYEAVESEKLVEAWRDGFVNNQEKATLAMINERMNQFYGYFDRTVNAKEQYILDYIPGQGTAVTKNGKLLGLIPGEDFQKALLEIWLGNTPADKGLKRGMLGAD